MPVSTYLHTFRIAQSNPKPVNSISAHFTHHEPCHTERHLLRHHRTKSRSRDAVPRGRKVAAHFLFESSPQHRSNCTCASGTGHPKGGSCRHFVQEPYGTAATPLLPPSSRSNLTPSPP